jgi:Double zinc ribbon
VLESIKEFIEFLAEDLAQIGATLTPWILLGLLALYVLWLVIGYLRVSQVGLGEGHARRQVLELPSSSSGTAAELPRGVAYCSFDQLQYPVGATFCTACERDLLLDCVNCGATVAASEAFCYRCGTPTGAAETSNAG